MAEALNNGFHLKTLEHQIIGTLCDSEKNEQCIPLTCAENRSVLFVR